jgi:HAD superfamily hydrolase (TIGR01509 family)
MDFQGAIFDLDGTLLDSMWIWDQIDIDFLAKRGFAVPDDYQKSIAAMTALETAEYTIARFGLSDKPQDLVEEWLAMARDAYANRLELKEGALDYLKYLHEAGVRMSVASASDPELVIPALKRTGVFPLLDHVITVREVKRGKGFPDIYLESAARMSVAPEDCVVFEDILEGIRAAKIGGFRTVGVREVHNTSSEEEIRREADRYIDSFCELLYSGAGTIL